VARRLLEIHSTPPHGDPALISALEAILVVTMPGVAETFKCVIDEMTPGTDFELVNLLHAENANLIHEDLNTTIDEPENRWNIHVVSQDTLTSRAKPSSNGQLSYCAWNFGIFDESHRYKTKNSLGYISKKHFRPGGMAPSEWTRSLRAVRDTPVADYSTPGVNTTRRVAHRPLIAVSPFLPQTLREHSQMLLKAPAVMEVHSGRYEI